MLSSKSRFTASIIMISSSHKLQTALSQPVMAREERLVGQKTLLSSHSCHVSDLSYIIIVES